MTPSELNDFIITVAMLRGCEFDNVRKIGPEPLWIAHGCGHFMRTPYHTKRGAATEWLYHFGIWIDGKGNIYNLGTKVEP